MKKTTTILAACCAAVLGLSVMGTSYAKKPAGVYFCFGTPDQCKFVPISKSTSLQVLCNKTHYCKLQRGNQFYICNYKTKLCKSFDPNRMVSKVWKKLCPSGKSSGQGGYCKLIIKQK